MPLSTIDLNQPPYYDDFDPSKNFYRILFRPSIPVQARELTQIASILQNQIEVHGNHIFKEGSIVEGCAITHLNNLAFVRFDDYFANNAIFDASLFDGNTIIESSTTGLRAAVIVSAAGTKLNYPDTNRAYIRYLNSGTGDQKTFANNETVVFYQAPRSANVQIAVANTLQSNSTTSTIGSGYGMTVTDGHIYQKGFFVRVEPHTAIISDFSTNPGNTVVGFETLESVVTSDNDESLLDNALGYRSYTAPGAHRLKLVPRLIGYQPEEVANNTSFTPVVTFNFGSPIQKQTDPAYAQLGDELAKQKMEESGNYVVKPFTVDTIDSLANTDLIQARVSPGIGYAQGHRVELLQTAYVDVRRGIDFTDAEDQLITTNYGNYIRLNNVAGSFDVRNGSAVTIYDAAQNALINHTFANLSPTGNVVGTAKIRSIQTDSGTVGTSDEWVKLYVYDIRMNSGKNFGRDARSVYLVDGSGNKSVGNIWVDGGAARVYDTQQKGMIFSFGKNSIKKLSGASGNNNTQYYVRTSSNATLATNGSISVSLPSSHNGGTDKFPYGVGVIGDINEAGFTVVALANTQSANLTGTVSGNTTNTTLVGTGTSFSTQFSYGEIIKIDHGATSELRYVAGSVTNTSLILDAPLATANASAKYAKYFPAGYRFPLDNSFVGNRQVNIISDTSAAITVGTDVVGTLSNSIPVRVQHDILRTSALPIAKSINKNRFVKINTANNTAGVTGPWNLGLTDIHKIRNVWVGTGTYANSNPNLTSQFYYNNGQTDTLYDHGKLFLKSGALTSNSTILVELDHFVSNTAPGIGFYSIESYPIDANTSNTSAITVAEIPVYQNDNGTVFSLRDSIDFRSSYVNTATSASDIASATINPPTTTTLSVDPDGLYTPRTGSLFEADIQYYLGRKDLLYFTSEGMIHSKESQPSSSPVTPVGPENTMGIAVLEIPPYPSLSAGAITALNAEGGAQSNAPVRDTSKKIKINIVTNRRYTMRDIGVLDDRISRLELYQALSLLEKAAADMQIPDENGLDRFKNGIFVDPLTSHINGDVSNPEYRISIDEQNGYARPYVSTKSIDTMLDANTTSGIVSNGGIVTLPFTHVKLIEQTKASKYRNAAPSVYLWNGQLFLYPSYNHSVNTQDAGQVQVTLDLASAWEDFANSPWGTAYGEWRTTSSDKVTTNSSTVTSGSQVITTTSTTTDTTAISTRTNQKLNVEATATNYNLGSYVTNVTVQPYLNQQIISFKATGLRPSTTVYAFFDNEAVSSYCAPGVRNNAVTDIYSNKYVTRTGNWGAALKTDANGMLYGQFSVPANRFRVGDRQFKLLDVSNATLGADATTTSASAVFTGSATSVTKQSITLTAITPEISTVSWSDTSVATTSKTTTNVNITEVPATPVSSAVVSKPPSSGSCSMTPGVIYYTDDGYYLNCKFVRLFSSNSGADPIGQSIRILIPTGISGTFVSKIDLFFKKKSATGNGVTVYLSEISSGYPDRTRILPYSRVHLTPSQVNVSDDSSVATTFTFEAPVYLANNLEYAFVIKPDGNDPDYLVWFAELGATDVQTGAAITSQPYIGVSYLSSNESTWTALQNEDIKFIMYRANFTSFESTVDFVNQDDDFLTIKSLSYNSPYSSIAVGDYVYYAANTANIATVNSSIVGYVQEWNPNSGELWLDSSTGRFAANTGFQIHRPANTSSVVLNANTLVASGTISSIDNPRLNAIAPRFGNIQPPGTSLNFSYSGTSNSYVVDSEFYPVTLETETELFDYERMIASRSNEHALLSDTKSLRIRASLTSQSSYLSPLLDLRRRNVVAIHNLIDPTAIDLTGEYDNAGPVKSKYLSKVITLLDGQDAEDIRVILTAVRPPGSDIICYVKFRNGEDPEPISQKRWTPLVNNSSALYSDANNTQDWKEFTFVVNEVTNGINNIGYYDTASDPPALTYTAANGAAYQRFKQFQIKWVLLADSSARVPRVTDVMAIALQS